MFSRVFVDSFLAAGHTGWVGPLLVGMALTACFRGLLTWMQQRSLLRLETKLSLTSSFRFFRHVLRLPVEFFTQRYGGEVGSRVEMNDRMAQLLSGELAANLLNVLMCVFYVALMAYYDVPLTLVGVAVAALNVVALRYVSRRRRDVNLRLLQERAKLTGDVDGRLANHRDAQGDRLGVRFLQPLVRLPGQGGGGGPEDGRLHLGLGAVPPLLSALNTAAILGLGSLRVINGEMTVGMLVAFQGLMMGFLEPVNQLVGLGGSLQEIEGETDPPGRRAALPGRPQPGEGGAARPARARRPSSCPASWNCGT